MATNPTALKIYPSGFVGSASVAQTTPVSVAHIARSAFDNSAALRPVIPHTASLAVVELWRDVLAAERGYKTFEFGDRVLRLAIDTFGVTTLAEWLQAQVSSPEWSDSHRRWLDETLAFVFEGKPRQVHHRGWTVILSCGENSKAPDGYSETVQRLVLQGPRGERSLSVREFLVRWVRQPKGLDDLVETLNVLYGSR